MFEPRETIQERVLSIKFYCSPIHSDKYDLQFNVAQIEYKGPVDPSLISFSFCLPPGISLDNFSDVPLQDIFVIEKLGCRFPDRIQPPVRDPGLMHPLRSCVVDADPSIVSQTGCQHLVRGTPISASEQCKEKTYFLMGWCHDIARTDAGDPYLFIPTFNNVLQTWVSEIIVPKYPGIRFGTESVHVDGISDMVKITPNGNCVPCQNFYVYINQDKRTRVSNRLFLGTSGGRAIDTTAGRRVSFFEAGLQIVPVVCGCYLFDEERFGGLHIPMVITERMSRLSPVKFSDIGGSSVLVEIEVSPGLFQRYTCNPEARHEHEYVNWCEFKKFAI